MFRKQDNKIKFPLEYTSLFIYEYNFCYSLKFPLVHTSLCVLRNQVNLVDCITVFCYKTHSRHESYEERGNKQIFCHNTHAWIFIPKSNSVSGGPYLSFLDYESDYSTYSE
jgi:hypothetical protein